MDKIAIVRRNGLGDLLCAMPLFHFLQKKYPEAQITFFVDAKNAPLLRFIPEKINTVIFPKKGNKYFNLIALALKHRRTRFDLAISAKTSPMKMMVLFLFFLGAKKRVAFVSKKWQRWLVTDPVIENPSSHQSLKSLQMIAPECMEISEEFYPRCTIPAEITKKYASLVQIKGPILLMTASTTKESSRMDEKKYAGIVNKLYKMRPFSVILVGQVGDKGRIDEIASHLEVPYESHVPNTFEEFMFLLNLAELYFVGDGGIGHIGAALKKHEVVFFGQTQPSEWRPLNADCITFFDPKSVNFLPDEMLLEALKSKYDEVFEWSCASAFAK